MSSREEKVVVVSTFEKSGPETALPHVQIDWTEKELVSLTKLLSSKPAKPTAALIRAMKS